MLSRDFSLDFNFKHWPQDVPWYKCFDAALYSLIRQFS